VKCFQVSLAKILERQRNFHVNFKPIEVKPISFDNLKLDKELEKGKSELESKLKKTLSSFISLVESHRQNILFYVVSTFVLSRYLREVLLLSSKEARFSAEVAVITIQLNKGELLIISIQC
jgi:hypothetical protein